jgi:hypothetical protein
MPSNYIQEESHMNSDFYVRVERSIDATVQLVPVEEASPSDPNGIDVTFFVRSETGPAEAFTVRGRLIDGEPHWDVGQVDPLARDRVSGAIWLGSQRS